MSSLPLCRLLAVLAQAQLLPGLFSLSQGVGWGRDREEAADLVTWIEVTGNGSQVEMQEELVRAGESPT